MTAVYCIAYFIVFLVGLIGNSFVIAVVFRAPRMRTVTNYFIANLALADFLVIVFCLPATLLSNIFVRKYYPFNQIKYNFNPNKYHLYDIHVHSFYNSLYALYVHMQMQIDMYKFIKVFTLFMQSLQCLPTFLFTIIFNPNPL